MRRKPRLQCSMYPLLLCSLLLGCPYTANAQSSTSPSFEVASVRPCPPSTDPNIGHWSVPGIDRFTASCVSLTRFLQLAYGIDNSQIANKPGWLDTNLYDIDAKPEPGISLTRNELKPRLQNLLHERFHLVVHMETRFVRGYALVVAKGGLHLKPTKAEHFPGWRNDVSPGHMGGVNWSMPQLAQYLSPAAGFPVTDQTGIAGSYDIDFSYNPKPDDTSSNLPSLNEALKQATGLQLKERKIPVETMVIDSVDKTPTAN
jgi:uncharacterized protein (TIGR03435 family)